MEKNQAHDIERRCSHICIRKAEADTNMTIEGYAAVFNSKTEILPDLFEQISSEAFAFCDDSDCVLRYNHIDSLPILARTSNGSLSLDVDERGLKITAKLLDTQTNRDFYAMISSGLINKMSFAFTVSDDAIEKNKDGTMVRTIKAINKLYDVSIVDNPAYESTSVSARSKDEYRLFTESKHIENKKKGDSTMNEVEERTAAVIAQIPAIQSAGSTVVSHEMEKRQAFYEYIKTGKIADCIRENRNDAFTTTTDASAVIPTTIMQELIKKVSTYGQILSRVRRINVKGGVRIPIVSLKPSASWITEARSSDRKKIQINSYVSFGYHMLECKIATSFLVDVTTLDLFERSIVEMLSEAMITKLEDSIINGTGADNGQPVGILYDERIPSGQKLSVAASELTSYSGWINKVVKNIQLSYNSGAFIMSKGTFDQYIRGLVDNNGQPVARVNYGINGEEQHRFLGKEVILVESTVLPDAASAEAGKAYIIYANLNDYILNTNMAMTMKRYADEDNNQYVDKAMLVADGKLADVNSVLIVHTPVQSEPAGD